MEELSTKFNQPSNALENNSQNKPSKYATFHKKKEGEQFKQNHNFRKDSFNKSNFRSKQNFSNHCPFPQRFSHNKSQNNHFRQANHHNQEFFRMTGVKYHNLLTRVKFNHSFRIPLILCLLLARFVYCPVTLLDIAQKQNFGLILMNQTHLYLFPQIKSGGPRYCC